MFNIGLSIRFISPVKQKQGWLLARCRFAVMLTVGSFLAATLNLANAQTPIMADDSQKVRLERVLNGLLPSFVTTETKAMSLAERMAFYKVPGVSIAVIDKGKIAWTLGFGVRDVTTGAPVDAATLFQAASISKPVSALAALRLVELKQLSLDTDINETLSSWQVPKSDLIASEKVTLRRLLSHSAGLSVSGFAGYEFGAAVPSITQVLAGIAPANSEPVRVFYTPKTRVEYSGGGFTVVQQAMMDSTKESFDQTLDRLVIAPLNMRNSAFSQPLALALRDNAAAGHDGKAAVIPGLYRTHPELAAAGLWTTSNDLAKFAQGIQKALRPEVSQERILSRAMANEMLTVQAWPYGLGFVLEGEGSASRFSHRGANFGYQCILIAFKNEEAGLAILTNSNNANGLIQELIRSIATEYNWPALAPKRYAVQSLEQKDQTQFVGFFKNSQGQQIRIRQDEGKLIAQSGGGWASLAWLGNDQFALVDQQAEFALRRNSNQEVTQVSLTKEGNTSPDFIKALEPVLPLDAQTVYLRGSMNNWGLDFPMSKSAPFTYKVRVKLNAGFNEFKVASEKFDLIDLGSLPNQALSREAMQQIVVPVGKNIQLLVSKAGLYEFELIAKPQADALLSVKPIE